MAWEDGEVKTLLLAATSTTTGDPVRVSFRPRAVFARLAGTGAVTGTVVIYGNNDGGTTGIAVATLTLSGTDDAVDGGAFDAPYAYLFADLTAISGTGAAITVSVAN